MAAKITPRKVFENVALKIGDTTSIEKEITFTKKGWFAALLELAITLTVGTGTGAIANSEMNFFKNLVFGSDLDGDSHMGPAIAFWNYASLVKEVAVPKDAMAAASATYRLSVPLFFADPLSKVPEQTLFDQRRYDAGYCKITCGTVADLLTSVGTSSVTAAASMTALETREDLPAGFSPMFYSFMKTMAAVNHTDLLLKIQRLPNQRLRRQMYMLCTGATAGVPFSGVPADLGITNISIDNGKSYEMRNVSRTQIQNDNLGDFKRRSTGVYMLDFMRTGDLDESLIMHPSVRSKHDMTWDTDTATATTVNMLADFVQELKAG